MFAQRPTTKVLAKCTRVSGRCLGVTLGLLLCTVAVVFPKDEAARDARFALIRGLVREIAVSKITLPRGNKGVRVDLQGKLDQAKVASELHTNGEAIKAGMPVEITKMAFKSNAIVFELNGGGRNKTKWYQHIEVGAGPGIVPLAQKPLVDTYGSSITLTYPGKVSDLTVAKVKQALSSVLDFERHSPTVLYVPSVPPKIKEAIKKHQVIVGMDRDAVLSAKGPPDRRVREVRGGVEQEDWIYGSAPHVLFVTFDGDTVVAVKQY